MFDIVISIIITVNVFSIIVFDFIVNMKRIVFGKDAVNLVMVHLVSFHKIGNEEANSSIAMKLNFAGLKRTRRLYPSGNYTMCVG